MQAPVQLHTGPFGHGRRVNTRCAGHRPRLIVVDNVGVVAHVPLDVFGLARRDPVGHEHVGAAARGSERPAAEVDGGLEVPDQEHVPLEVDLRTPLRARAGAAELAGIVREAWGARTDRGAEERVELRARTAFRDGAELKRDPHLEMHTRGG